MLSTSAFNALLKTLEEPPAHVKFIFATTEIRKVPVTVLSRCQRFDLRRIEPEAMLGASRRHRRARGGAGGAGRAGADRAGGRGVGARRAVAPRPGDRARRRRGERGGGPGDARARRPRAGARPLRGGDGAATRGRRSPSSPRSTRAGADPLAVLRDLAEVTHWVSMVKLAPEAADDPTVGPGRAGARARLRRAARRCGR